MTRERTLWAALAVTLVAAWWYSLPPPATPTGEYVAAQPAPELKRAKVTTIKPKQVKAYASNAKAALKLPAAQQADESLYVLGASKLAASERPRTLITTLDADTGEVRQDVRNDPLPWIAAESRGSVWLGAGLNGQGERVARVAGSYDVLQVKALHLGAHASLDTDGSRFAGVGVAYRF